MDIDVMLFDCNDDGVIAQRYVKKIDPGYYEDYENGSSDFTNELFQGMPRLTKVVQVAFVQVLREYCQSKYTTLYEQVRGYVPIDDSSFLMHHGVGYDWVDKDLLGGNGDGTNVSEFKKFAAEKDIEFNLIYE